MIKKFLSSLSLLLLLNLLIKPFWILGIDRVVQNTVGTENFGFYFALLNFAFLFNMLLDFGVTTYNNRNISQNQYLVKDQFSQIIILKLSFALIYTVATFSLAYIIGYDKTQYYILAFLCFNQFLQSFILFMRSNLTGLHLFKSDAIISILDRTFMILICGILLWSNLFSEEFQILWFVYAQTLAYFTVLLIASFLVLKRTRGFVFTWQTRSLLSVFKNSLPFALMVLLMSVYMRTDAVMLERLLPDGSKAAGVYAQGYRLLEACNMFAYLIAIILLPLFSKMIKEKKDVEYLTGLSFRLIIVPAVIIVCCSFYYSTEIITLLYSEYTLQSATVFSILMLCFIPIATSYIFGTLLTANGNMKAINLMATAGILINISLNLLLIPKYQAIGAAIASLITQFAIVLIQVILTQYIFRFTVNYKLLISLLIFFTGTIGIAFYWNIWMNNWYLDFVLMIGCIAIFALILNIINVKSIKTILKIESERTI